MRMAAREMAEKRRRELKRFLFALRRARGYPVNQCHPAAMTCAARRSDALNVEALRRGARDTVNLQDKMHVNARSA